MVQEIDLKNLVSDMVYGKTYTHCRLCLSSIENDSFLAYSDDVHLEPQFGTSCVSIATMLDAVLGPKDAGAWVPLENICTVCASAAVNCYQFLEKCRNSQRQLHEIFNNLILSVDPALMEYPKAKAVYVIMGEDESKIIFDRKSCVKNMRAVKKRLGLILLCEKEELKKEIKQELFQCAECGQQLPNETLLRRHSILHSSIYYCEKCNRSFHSNSKLRYHNDRFHAKKIFKCPNCPRRYATTFLRSEHVQSQHISCKCNECGKICQKASTLKKHKETHKQKICEKCGKTYKDKKYFQKHLSVCVNGLLESQYKARCEELYTCDTCQKKYLYKRTLKAHISLEHGNGKALICDWCGKKFAFRSRLAAHTVKHTRERNFACAICGGVFVTKEALVYHTRRHTGEKPYPCTKCDLSFLSASRRMEHIRRKHLGPTLECDICSRKFLTKACQKKHMEKHNDPDSRLFVRQIDVVAIKEEEI